MDRHMVTMQSLDQAERSGLIAVIGYHKPPARCRARLTDGSANPSGTACDHNYFVIEELFHSTLFCCSFVLLLNYWVLGSRFYLSLRRTELRNTSEPGTKVVVGGRSGASIRSSSVRMLRSIMVVTGWRTVVSA
jgi:hypothetical protein